MMHHLRVLFFVGLFLAAAWGSSHSEAPGTAKMPQADDADFYAFVSYETGRENYVTFIKNVEGRQGPGSGPNYYALSDEHFYEIYIDTNGDLVEDITFQFVPGFTFGGTKIGNISFLADEHDCPNPGEVFKTTNVGIELTNGGVTLPIALKVAGVITAASQAALNQHDYYSINYILGGRDSTNSTPVSNVVGGGTQFTRPMDNAGEKSFPDYKTYADQYLYDIHIPGCATAGRVFVGQRKESFSINLGGIFDLFNFVPIPGFPGAVAETNANNYLSSANVASFILEVPIACLNIPAASQGVIGTWTAVRELLHDSSGAHITGPQVSRLGAPLVNELVVGQRDKFKFNGNPPPMDGALFLTYVQNPTFPAILSSLFLDTVNAVLGISPPLTDLAPNNFPRDDLVATFLTGIPNLNKFPGTPPGGEMLRLNTSIPPTVPAQQMRYGVLAGDQAGFPNGRRPGDDIVDIEVQVLMGALCYLTGNPWCTSANAPVGNVLFTDGSPQSVNDFDYTFPYLKTPLPGYKNNQAITASPAASLQPALMQSLLSLFA